MSLSIAAVAPVRGLMCNLRTGESMPLLLNPTELREQVRVNYSRLQVPGLSHEVLQFQSTGNTSLPVEFYVDKFFARTVSVEQDPDILDFKRFLQALTVPSGGAQDIAAGGPPRALFVWPGLVSVTCVVTSLEFRYELFGVGGEVLVYRAQATLEEIRDLRVTSEELRTLGSERGGM
ncbi:peptidoglycan-binding protein [Haliangium sp.]|uniref:CIS tube protein n=1 Tax=Haliangium sp. TaxID=2663208 RepID=UPI003D0AE44F